MGKYSKGILGPFQGTVGTVVGSSWKGIDYLKSKMKRSARTASQAQLEQQAKFSLITRFVSPIAALLQKSFDDSAVKMTGINAAFRHHYENAITGTYPSFLIDYSKALISRGRLHNASNIVAVPEARSSIKIDWTDNSGMAMSNADDTCIVAVYCPALKRWQYTTAGSARSVGSFSFPVTAFAAEQVEVWVGFINAGETEASTSIYAGHMTIS